MNSRELRQKNVPKGLAGGQWRNADNAWFRREEAAKFLPQPMEKGARSEVPRELLERVARFHLVDNITGLPYPFPKEAVEKARLSVEVVEVKDGVASVRFEGETRTSLGRCPQAPQGLGYESKLLGRGTYDSSARKFTQFELVALGQRWGAMMHSERILFDDLGPASMGFVFAMAGDTRAERLPPLFFDAYGW